MDCEKFETALMDELYGELDELTSAAAKRHVSGCARCSALIGGLRATRRVAALPRVDPPEGLEQRILAAAARATPKVVPLRGRVARAISLAGSWAMRPQTAMAAVFLVMIGTSVLLLRGKSSRAPASAQITVTEEGTPAPAAPPAAVANAESTAVAASAPIQVPLGAMAPGREKGADKTAAAPVFAQNSFDDSERRALAGATKMRSNAGGGGAPLAEQAFAAPPPAAAPAAAPAAGLATDEEANAAEAKPADPSDELWAARAARDAAARQGHPCPSGARFDAVASRAPGTQQGWDALYEGALCYLSAGDYGSARTRLGTLLGVPTYSARARATLDRMNKQLSGGAGAEPAARAAPVVAAAPAPTPAQPPPPAGHAKPPAPSPASVPEASPPAAKDGF